MRGCLKQRFIAGAIAMTSIVAIPSYAQTTGTWMGGKLDMGWFAGANIGQSRTEIEAGDIALPPGVAFTSFSSDETEVGFKVYGGYRLNRNLAVEFGYARLGEFTWGGTTAPPGSISSDFKNDGWFLDLVGILPLQNNFSVLGRIGAYYNKTKANFTASGPGGAGFVNLRERETNLKLGLGVQYDFTPQLGVRAEWEHFRKVGDETTTGEANINLFSIGAVYRFP